MKKNKKILFIILSIVIVWVIVSCVFSFIKLNQKHTLSDRIEEETKNTITIYMWLNYGTKYDDDIYVIEKEKISESEYKVNGVINPKETYNLPNFKFRGTCIVSNIEKENESIKCDLEYAEYTKEYKNK